VICNLITWCDNVDGAHYFNKVGINQYGCAGDRNVTSRGVGLLPLDQEPCLFCKRRVGLVPGDGDVKGDTLRVNWMDLGWRGKDD
jgi:hypothetical protein